MGYSFRLAARALLCGRRKELNWSTRRDRSNDPSHHQCMLYHRAICHSPIYWIQILVLSLTSDFLFQNVTLYIFLSIITLQQIYCYKKKLMAHELVSKSRNMFVVYFKICMWIFNQFWTYLFIFNVTWCVGIIFIHSFIHSFIHKKTPPPPPPHTHTD